MGILKIYTTDIFRRVEIVNETIENVKSHSVKNGYIHIQYNDDSNIAGIHFPIPYNFVRVEYIK
jgi:hypothetical protein